jgi:O-antigen/teichoic acid export membrane protein
LSEHAKSEALLNTALRALTMASRFALVFVLARLLPPEVLGEYGLVAAAVGFSLIAVGLDFYTFTTRELLATDQSRWPTMVRDQLVFALFGYAVVLPVSIGLFFGGVLPLEYLGFFLVLLVFEHLAQEINRLLIVIGRPLRATMVLFLRSGLWVWIAIGLMGIRVESRDLRLVFGLWIIGGGSAIAMGLWVLRDLPWRAKRPPVDWTWIRRGVRVAAVLFAANLCYRSILIGDRFAVDLVAGRELLGVYTLYVGVAAAVTVFLDSAVIAFLYPRVVAAFRGGDLDLFHSGMRTLRRQTVAATLILAAGAVVGMYPVLVFLDQPIYATQLPVFWLLVGGMSLYSLSMIPHYGLYAMGHDRGILAGNALSLVVFLVISALAGARLALPGVALGVAAGLTSGGLLKAVEYRKQLALLAPSK